MKRNYYLAYDIANEGDLVGIAYQDIGKRGGRHKPRWFEPVHRHVSRAELKVYQFVSYSWDVELAPADWVRDDQLKKKGKHIESK